MFNKAMNRLIKAIQAGKFAWEKYLNGKTWNGIKLHTCPLFCSYGQIGYTVAVFSGNAHTHNYTRLGDEHNKMRICLTRPRHNGKTMRTKTAKEIISQAKRIFAALDKTAPDYSIRLHSIAEIARAYLHNIARHYGKPYRIITWMQIGNKSVPREIYAKQV